MSRLSKLLIAAAVAATTLAGANATASPAQPALSAPSAGDHLYRALGGQPGIDALMLDLAQRVKIDPRIGHFFDHTKPEGLAESLSEQVCALTHGPCPYHGAKMGPAHSDLGIARADFNRLVEVLQDTMDAHVIPFATQRELLALLAPMYRDVITR